MTTSVSSARLCHIVFPFVVISSDAAATAAAVSCHRPRRSTGGGAGVLGPSPGPTPHHTVIASWSPSSVAASLLCNASCRGAFLKSYD